MKKGRSGCTWWCLPFVLLPIVNTIRRGDADLAVPLIMVAIAASLTTYFYFYRVPYKKVAKEVQDHIDTLFSLSGKLTPEERETFISTTQALAEIIEQQTQEDDEEPPFISDEELERIQKHTVTLVQENPELAMYAHGRKSSTEP